MSVIAPSPGAPIVTGICAETAVLLRAAARKHGVASTLLAQAILHAVLDGEMVDAVLDGEDPEHILPAVGATGKAGLTMLRCGVVYLAGLHSEPDGTCRFSARQMAGLAGCTVEAVQRAVAGLTKRGLLQVLKDGSHSVLALTPAGRRLANALGDLGFGEGGKA